MMTVVAMVGTAHADGHKFQSDIDGNWLYEACKNDISQTAPEMSEIDFHDR